jgi:hypothetical protein
VCLVSPKPVDQSVMTNLKTESSIKDIQQTKIEAKNVLKFLSSQAQDRIATLCVQNQYPLIIKL